MLNWEIKKISKDKTSIIALILIAILFLQISIAKPMLETQNEYWDEAKDEYIIDNRSKDVIGNEKLKAKVDEIKLIANSSEDDKSLIDLCSEKLKIDDGNKYEDIDFYKVFTYRLNFTLSIIIMLIIILLIVPNLYTDEVVSNTAPIILSSKNKNKVLFSKLGLSILLPILLYGLYIGYVFLITYMQYGQPINGNLQAYRISDIAILTKAITINQYMISKIITTGLMLLGISIMSMLVSFLSNNSVKSIVLSVGFIVLGKILTLFTFLPKSLIVVLGTSNYIDVAMGMSQISGIYNGNIDILSKSFDISNLCVSIYGLIIVFGILGCIYSIKKVLVK
ncbi:MAG: hypothetical protein ACRDA3_05790 [Peptostreptococcaceae bacterium]